MTWLFHSIAILIFMFIVGGCTVGTNSSTNIPKEKTDMILEDASNWGQDITSLVFDVEIDEIGFKAKKIVFKEAGEIKSGLEAVWLYKDDDIIAPVFATIKRKYNAIINQKEILCSDVIFRELNISERVVVLKSEINSKLTLELWIHKNTSIIPAGEYLEDVIINTEVYGMYRDGKTLILDKEKAVSEFNICWNDLESLLKEKEILTDGIDYIENIALGFKIFRGREIFIIDKFENFYKELEPNQE